MLSDSFNRVLTDITMFENNRKSLIQFCERSDIRLQCSGQKFIENAKNGQFWRVFSKNKIENFNLQARNKIIFLKQNSTQCLKITQGVAFDFLMAFYINF